MSRPSSHAETPAAVTIEIAPGMDELFGEDIGPVMVGFPLTKVLLMRDLPPLPDETHRRRRVVGSVTLPTTAFLRIGDVIRQVMRDHGESYEQALEKQQQDLQHLLASTSSPDPSGSH